ncbi:CocE/NonD family hydrolase [Lentzea sp. NBRC 105346]|uniref:CocE/NonD family hydrolase n=1 Tax=Lentzea sp. NBRC 105346 TaxID=3032205 RepID=UPI0025528444|nr:CocE/NonD family hydrolase [Lentzea sp. NBRC 105346]
MRWLLAVLLVLGGATAANADTGSKTTLHFDVVVGPNDDTHCDVVADLYRPATTAQVPAVLTTNGFGGSKDDQAAIAAKLVNRGYAVLSYSGLGFGGSGCKITLDDPDWDGKAGKQLVDFLAGTKAAKDGTKIGFVKKDGTDPRVGMIGGSYGGQIQFAVASIDPRVDALVPVITWNDLSYSLAPNNGGSGPGVHKRHWSGLFFGEGILDGLTGATIDPARNVGCPNFTDQACAAMAQLLLQGYPSPETTAFARHASVASYMSKVKAPTLLMQGQADTLFNLQEAAATYRGLKQQGTTVKMIWQKWGHSDSAPAPGEEAYLEGRYFAWFDRYLKKASVNTGPDFAYFQDWSGTYDSGTYPVGTTRQFPLTGAQTYTNAPVPTSYSETSALQSSIPDQLSPLIDGPGTFAQWTVPVTQDLVTVGMPALDLNLAAPAAEVVLFAKLYDVAPDGTVTLQHRLISPARVDPAKPVHVELPGVVKKWQAGHSIRVVVAASDAAYAGNVVPIPVTVNGGTLGLPVR